ncbi:MAG TPA: hypothetical protein VID27_19345, partial [Blastocatellia bacterium]
AEKLNTSQFHQVFVDGLNISLPTDISTDGYFKLVLTSDGSSGRLLPASLRPVVNIRHVEIRNQTGETILQGDFRPGSIDDNDDGGGGGTTPGSSREATFIRTGPDADAEGRARTKIESEKEEFIVELSKLEPGATYKIVVDAFPMGSFTADGSGSLKREWSSEAESGKLLLPARFHPVTIIRRVEIRTVSGALILVAEFST